MPEYQVLFTNVYDRQHLIDCPADYYGVTVEAENRDEAISKAYGILHKLDLDGTVFECEITTDE